MKRKLFMLLLTPLVLASSGCDKKEEKPKDLGPVNVILISGQSNAVGCSISRGIKTSIDIPTYNRYAAGFNDVLISYDCWTKDDFDKPVQSYYSQNKSKGFVPVKLGQGNMSAEEYGDNCTFGPEIGIADALHERFGGKLFIIKYACGASNLKDDWAPTDSPMYPRFIKYVKAEMKRLQKMGYRPTIKAFCWMQGEGDTYNGYHQHYLENTRTFVANVRNEFRSLAGDKEIPFIDAQIAPGDWTFWSEVNIAKRTFSQESDNNFLIQSIQEGLHTDQEAAIRHDNAHFDSDSEVQLGRLFAQNCEQFLELPEEVGE